MKSLLFKMEPCNIVVDDFSMRKRRGAGEVVKDQAVVLDCSEWVGRLLPSDENPVSIILFLTNQVHLNSTCSIFLMLTSIYLRMICQISE